MNIRQIKSNIVRNISNIPGWSTKRKIVVVESDDWGSIRMSSLNSFEALKKSGIDESLNHYNLYDALECNDDLSCLFETLQKFKDSSNRSPVLTAVNIVANPDFDKIKANDFSEYFYEPFTETLKRYPAHDNVYSLWMDGIENRLVVPVFHGREHLNVKRWITALQQHHKTTHKAFEYGVTGIYSGINNEFIPDFQAAFDIDSPQDTEGLTEVIETGLDLFETIFGYKSEYFVPTNGPFNNSLEAVLFQKGIKYINSAKIQIEPLGNGKYRKNTRFLGSKNHFGQRYITRNCFFEPSSMEHPANTDWVGNCLKQIEIAFRWNKPAVISTHRVNYVGFLYPQNREKGLTQLQDLFKKMLNKWPDIEFMTSVELGNLIKQSGQ